MVLSKLARSCCRIVLVVSVKCPHIVVPVVMVWCIPRECSDEKEAVKIIREVSTLIPAA